MKLPNYAEKIIALLDSEGFSAFAVGGFVRDSLMGRPCSDVDICTSAAPEQTRTLFEKRGYKVLPTGIKHGTVTVMRKGEGYEVTTFRIDGAYSDGRHPDSVSFTGDIIADLSRRDFTINAMAFSPSAGLIDPFGGAGDIEKRIIKAVGCPDRRFSEDALRMLRAVRFAAKLGFDIDPATRASIKRLSGRLASVSPERVCSEFSGILLSPGPELIMELYELGLAMHIIPALMPILTDGPVHTRLRAIGLLPAVLELRLAALFSGNPELAEPSLKRLRYPNSIIRRASELAKVSNISLSSDNACIKRFLGSLDNIFFEEYEAVRRAVSHAFGDMKQLEVLKRARSAYDNVITRGEPYLMAHLAINGKDLAVYGCSGRQTGVLLSSCLEHVINNPADNTKPRLLEVAKELLSKS